MERDRKTLVLYTSSICNLKCEYCYIDKNPALLEIDKILIDSFKGDYYFNFAKKMFPDPFQLREIQFWGGEPSIGLGRTEYTIFKLIKNYPNLSTFMMSTNLTLPNFCDIFSHFLHLLESFPDRRFEFNLQLSIDGPEYINDASRGKGVTKKFFDNYSKLLLMPIPKNVVLSTHFKPTLSTNSIRKLQTKESVIEYYQFLDKMIFMSKMVESTNYSMFEVVPNTATPSPHTKEDGIKFANLCHICNQIEDDGLENYFNCYLDTIVPFRRGNIGRDKNEFKEFARYSNCGHCGMGKFVVGLLPSNMISCCHNGFVDLISDYKKECLKTNGVNTSLDTGFFHTQKTRLALTLEEFADFEKVVENYYKPNLKVKNANAACLINTLARIGQVDKRFIDVEDAAKAAEFMNNRFSYCIRDNINSTGCLELPPIGQFRLLLNGAMEEILIK